MSEGLGAVSQGDGTFLSIAGGYIWDRKADKSHPNYAEQEFEKQDKTIGVRTGAQYGDLTGRVTKVQFRTHPEYGGSINVTFLAAGKNYIVSISCNNRYSQDMYKGLLLMNLDKLVTIKPYDFIGQDKRRAQGLTFTQDGEKLSLKYEVPADYTKDEGWFKENGKTDKGKKLIKRFFEDLDEWYQSEVEEKVVPNVKFIAPEKGSDAEKTTETKTVKEEKSTETEKESEKTEEAETETKTEERPATGVSILAMKKKLRAYIAENYPGEELPNLPTNELAKWYDLSMQEEELPFEEASQEEEQQEGELSDDELNDQLNNLMED